MPGRAWSLLLILGPTSRGRRPANLLAGPTSGVEGALDYGIGPPSSTTCCGYQAVVGLRPQSRSKVPPWHSDVASSTCPLVGSQLVPSSHGHQCLVGIANFVVTKEEAQRKVGLGYPQGAPTGSGISTYCKSPDHDGQGRSRTGVRDPAGRPWRRWRRPPWSWIPLVARYRRALRGRGERLPLGPSGQTTVWCYGTRVTVPPCAGSVLPVVLPY